MDRLSDSRHRDWFANNFGYQALMGGARLWKKAVDSEREKRGYIVDLV